MNFSNQFTALLVNITFFIINITIIVLDYMDMVTAGRGSPATILATIDSVSRDYQTIP